MSGVIRVETAILATPDDLYGWLAGRRTSDLEICLAGAGRITTKAVLQTRLPTRSPRSAASSIWILEAGCEGRALLLGHLRIVGATGMRSAKLRFEGRARVRKSPRDRPAPQLREEGSLLARQVLLSIASAVEARSLGEVRLSA